MSTAADSSTPAPRTTVYVTGFGPFANIKINPSATVAKKVCEALHRRGDLADVHFTELETSIVGASEYFDKLENTIDDALAKDPTQRVLLFHVGVHSREKHGIMRIETVGYNELHASVPDVRGVVFNHDVINAEDGDISAHLTTHFATSPEAREKLQSIVEALNTRNAERVTNKGPRADAFAANSRQNIPALRKTASDAVGGGAETLPQTMVMPEFQLPTWTLSEDAGRYLCNYCLYRSLQLQRKYAKDNVVPVASIFIHVCDPQQGITAEEAHEQTAGAAAVEDGQGGVGSAVARYNPSLMDQSQQTEEVAHELTEWLMGRPANA